MLATQKDVYSAYDLFLAKQVLGSCAKLHNVAQSDLLKSALEVLRKWNGQMEHDQAAPAIAELLSDELRLTLVKLLLPKAKAIPDILPRQQIVETLLQERPHGWVPNDDWDQWLVSSFSRALDAGRGTLGSAVQDWRWGYLLHWKFEHPVLKALPPVDWFFDATFQRSAGPFEMSGSSTTVKQTTSVLGPSERMVVDLGDLDRSVQNLVLGESGFISSSHFEDQWPAYYSGKSFPMQFSHIDAKDVLKITPQPN
jgi:penicillin amidase